MKRFCIHLKPDVSSFINLVEVKGELGRFENVLDYKHDIDYAVYDDQDNEIVRVPREHVLYIMTSEVSTS